VSHAHFPKLKALHAVFGLDCPYTDAERGMAAVLILDRDERDPADPKYGCAYRNQADMARRAGLKLRTGQRALSSLLSRTDGPLAIERVEQAHRGGANGRPPNWYRVEFRATLTQNPAQVSRHPDAKPNRGFPAKPAGVSRQTGGGFPATVTHDLCMDLSTDLSTPASVPSAGGFSLVSPDQKSQQPKKRPGTSKAKPEPKWPGAHAEVVAYYFEAFERARGAKAIFNGREAKAVTKLLDELAGDVPRCKLLIENGLHNWAGATIVSIAADPSKAVTRHASGRRPPPQNTGVGVDALFEGAQVIR